ncbi:hypothetical protein [Methanothermobacter sp.]|uniref:hypothetical protein n=1 Tax=Methanothermobacter sp. TaxID=1884223 RepID=UPI003C780C67
MIKDGAISRLNRIHNHILRFIACLLYHPVRDFCTDHWVFTGRLLINSLSGLSYPIELKAEMFSRISGSNMKIVAVPISYRRRSDEPKLSSLSDGFKIFRTLVVERLR